MKKKLVTLSLIVGLFSLLFCFVGCSNSLTEKEIPGYVKNIQLQINHENIDNTFYELGKGEKGSFLNVIIDTYGDNTIEYSFKSENEKVATISAQGEINALSIGETIITAYIKDNPEISDCFLLKVKGEEEVPINYTITVIGGIADYVQASQGTIITLNATVPSGKRLQSWRFSEQNVWSNGNIFKMIDKNITVTAVFEDVE